MTQAETTGKQLQAKEYEGLLATIRNQEKAKEKFYPEVQMKQYSANTLNFKLPASRTVRGKFPLF